MGCCFSNDEDKDNQDQSPSETTRLLNPVTDPPSPRPISSVGTSTVNDAGKGDEQSVLNRILHQTASNVIDVAALDCQAMEQSEYMDRARQYSVRLTIACGQLSPTANRMNGSLPVGVAAPQVLMASQPVLISDVNLIKSVSALLSKTTQDISVRHKEDLVVPFGVP